jgi:hypothetical protein
MAVRRNNNRQFYFYCALARAEEIIFSFLLSHQLLLTLLIFGLGRRNTNPPHRQAVAVMRHPIGHPTNIEHSEKDRQKSQRFSKLKELQSQHTRADTQIAAHLILPQRTQAHPPPQM